MIQFSSHLEHHRLIVLLEDMPNDASVFFWTSRYVPTVRGTVLVGTAAFVDDAVESPRETGAAGASAVIEVVV